MADCVVVVLHGDVGAAVKRLWTELGGRAAGPPGEGPHLTLAVIRGRADVDRLRAALNWTASSWAPFPATGGGYGVFLGRDTKSPVVHLSVTRSPALSALHEAVVRDIEAAGLAVEGQYDPQHWRPHVTLADRQLTAPAVGEAMRHLVEDGPRHWTIPVDNITLAAADGTVAFTLPLGGGARRTRAARPR